MSSFLKGATPPTPQPAAPMPQEDAEAVRRAKLRTAAAAETRGRAGNYLGQNPAGAYTSAETRRGVTPDVAPAILVG